jgi:hypothetical protein
LPKPENGPDRFSLPPFLPEKKSAQQSLAGYIMRGHWKQKWEFPFNFEKLVFDEFELTSPALKGAPYINLPGGKYG